jgi:hydrogenase maturation protein HypF
LYPGEHEGADGIHAAQEQLASGKIVAIKGIGGFHLACDATNSAAVVELRRRKNRGDKPFGLMARDLEQVRRYAKVNPQEAEQLTQRQRPITLLRRKDDSALSSEVAPGTALVGFMLPYSPLHHLLIDDFPLVMTSGNLSDEPICRDNDEAKARLGSLADSFLLHNRDIHVVCDDSVVRIHDRSELPIRRARGYAPLPVRLPREVETVLAVGAELKSTFCLTKGEYAYLSPHIGDMENLETLNALERGLAHFRSIFRCDPKWVVCDLHPGYLSTRWAQEFAKTNNLPLLQVQHHHAHVASLMVEHGLSADKVIGISFDGTGYGTDGAVWGGEIFVADYSSFQRVAHLKYVPLPGGDAAIKKPYRMALVHLRAAGLDWSEDLPCVKAVDDSERSLLRRQLSARINCVDTSSMGRLFDAVASLLGICHNSTYEGQAAVELEMAATSIAAVVGRDAYRIELIGDNPTILDPTNLLNALVANFRDGSSPGQLAAWFHHAVADCIVNVCSRIRERMDISVVALTGGVFQNVLLLDLSKEGLIQKGFDVLTHRIVPPNDGGISLGQAVIGLTH